jgi:AcrR family transcriptional regulator
VDTAAVNPPKRGRKRIATREALERAAWALFARKGFAQTTVEDIAGEANVVTRTFFRYFPSKEAVLYVDSYTMLERFRHVLLARPKSEQLFAAVVASLEELADVVEADRERHLLRSKLLEDRVGSGNYDYLGVVAAKTAALAAAIATRTGADTNDVEVELTSRLALAVMDLSYRQWIATTGRESLRTLVAETARGMVGLVSTAPPPQGKHS